MEELANNNTAAISRQESCGEKNSQRMIVTSSPFTDAVEQKWNSIVLGGIGMMFIIIVFLAYRFLRTINQRLHSLEEILAKVIEKNNHLQHMIQASATTRYIPSPMESPPMVVSMQSQSSGSVPVPVPISVSVQAPVPVPVQASVNLDREILEELQELQAPVKPSVPVPINEISEGRIEEDVKINN